MNVQQCTALRDDADLVVAVLAGDKPAYGELYDRYGRLVRAVCYDKTQRFADAQDISQDVFLRAYQKLDTLRSPERFGSWLLAIAYRMCSEWWRRRKRDRHRYGGLESEDPPAAEAPSEDAEVERLRQTMLQLPEKERLALHAFYLLGQSVEQARGVLGLSRSGLYRVLERARKRLKRLMQAGGRNLP